METYLDAKDLDIKALVDALAPATEVGHVALTERLSTPITDIDELKRRQHELRGIKVAAKGKDTEIVGLIKVLKDTEADVVTVGQAADDERLKDYYTQILWSPKSFFARLNHLGWFNEIIVFLRTIFVPGLSVLLPIFIFLAPLIMFSILRQPITLTQYMDIIQGAIKKAMPSVLGAPRFAGVGGLAEMSEQFLHIGLAVVMLGASIWNQVSAAIHMRTIVADMRKRATSVQIFTKATQDLANLVGLNIDCGASWSFGPLGVFGDAWNDPTRITHLLSVAGYLDMLVSVARAKKTCFAQLDATTLCLTDVYHPGVPRDKRVMNSVTLGGSVRSQVLLTGPNRGGKSTQLKAVGYAVLMAQTVGLVFARKAAVPVFASIITALNPTDSVGLSLFETEIEFAKTVMGRLDKGATFLMMDEIFHGTNAHDGVEAAQVFLDQVYKSPSLFSIVSTHYMDLPERYGKDITQNLCMEASVNPEDIDTLIYSYRIQPGINTFSSVREILRERGLLRSATIKNKDHNE
jgi:hypothetical protein